MATASGLALLKPAERDPRLTSTRGTGDLILAALNKRVQRILIGIGGSATNDGGMGMARALGVRFLDAAGRELPEGGATLIHLAHVDLSRLDPRLARTHVEVACDVNNPLTGPRGAAYVYSPQKGATPAVVRQLDAGLRQFAKVLRRDLHLDVENVPGAGAAGGLGSGLLAFLHGQLRPGIDIVIDAVDLRKKLRGVDLVITGEGRMDPQTAHGKAPAGVARIAAELGIPTLALCGSMAPNTHKSLPPGILACFSALEELMPEETLPSRAADMLQSCAHHVAKLLAL
jgi:glycerate kinase